MYLHLAVVRPMRDLARGNTGAAADRIAENLNCERAQSIVRMPVPKGA